MLRTAVEFVHTVRRTKHPRTGQPINVRIGLHCGSVVGGVIGTRAFRYDCWGPDVLLANKYESGGVAGGINVSAAMRDVIVDLQANRAFAIPGLVLHPHEGGEDVPEGGMFLVEIAEFGLTTVDNGE
jgi:class 3 adenylate cyclase